MRFGILGPLAVWTSDGRPVVVPEVKVRALLADLLVHDGRVVSADRLAEDLWGERRPGDPANALQTKVSQLRKALEAGEPGGRALVVRRPPGYLLRAEAVDAPRFRELVARAKNAGPREREALLAEALASWRGAALADFADQPFAAVAARRLEEERLLALEDWAEVRLDLGEPVGGLADLVAAHPLRERLHALHLRALYRSGRQGEALDGYTELRKRLVGELGVEPGPGLQALHRAILAQDPALDAVVARPRTNLPAPVTELIGRIAAVDAVRALVGQGRLVTLTGPGGVGKTRLAIETARGFADDVWLVELAGADRVVEAVAAVLDVRQDPGPRPVDLADQVVDVLRAKEVLVVLDNCEHLVGEAAEFTARLLRAAPGVRVLATSREPLGLDGEVVWSVPPLEVPGTATLRRGAAAVGGYGAVRLFTARAAASAPGFVLDEDNAVAVAMICRALDGIPLALELAASRMRVLGAHELLRRLDDRFRLPTNGYRDAPPRQRTLRAMIDWSWDLLSDAERLVLRRLSVHSDGCGLAAAEVVCAGTGVRPDEVLGLLAGLVDRSLVVSRVRGTAEPRYRLLETVAAYCVDRVREAGETDELRLRHAHHYLSLAERAELRGPEQRRWLGVLDAESANFRTALDTLVRQGEADLALRLAGALTWYWFLRGRLGEARRSLSAALAVDGGSADARGSALAWHAGLTVLEGGSVDDAAVRSAEAVVDPARRAMATWFLGYVLSTVAVMPTGERLTTVALAGFEALGDRWGIAAALGDRVSQAMVRGDFTAADHAAARCAELFDDLGDRWGRLQASFALGALASIRGDYAKAADLHREGLRMAEELELWPEVSYQLSWLGRIALLTKDYPRSREFHERGLRLAAEHSVKPAEMYAATGLAMGLRREGLLDEAEKHLLTVLAWHRRTAFEAGSTLVLAELGFVAEHRGDHSTARKLHLEGLAPARDSGGPRAVALALEGLAGAHGLAGDHVHAARLLGAATAARAAVDRPLPDAERGDVDRITGAARKALGERAFTVEFARGAESEVDDLVPDGRRAGAL